MAFFTKGAQAEILFSGLTPTGWQIFRCDDSGAQVEQLTHSLGDKRGPRYSEVERSVYYRDSAGKLFRVDREGGNEVEVPLESDGLSDFYLSGDTIYFNRRSTSNSLRRFVWAWDKGKDAGGELRLVMRRDVGSLRQVTVSPSGRLAAATYLWRRNEERIVLFETAPGKVSGLFEEVTPEFTVGTYPCWESEESILYSNKVSDDNYDLYRISLPDRAITPVIKSDDASEFSACVAAGGAIFFERQPHNTSSEPQIWSVESSTGEEIRLPLTMAAKEPFWYSHE